MTPRIFEEFYSVSQLPLLSRVRHETFLADIFTGSKSTLLGIYISIRPERTRTLRLVKSTAAVWQLGGIASTDVSGLFGCSIERDDHYLSLWADKVYKREKQQMRRVPDLVQGTREWLQERKKGVGGTEVAPLVGAAYKPWNGTGKTAEDVWADKIATGSLDDGVAENENIKRGRTLEPVARDHYQTLMDWTVPPQNVLHDEFDFVRCSLDGLRADDRLTCEIKCPKPPNHRKFLQIQALDDPRDRQTLFAHYFNYYRYQVLYQLLITGADVCHFVSYSQDLVFDALDRMAVIELYPEPGEQDRILRRVVEFWDFVEKRQPPPMEWAIPCWEPVTELRLPAASLGLTASRSGG